MLKKHWIFFLLVCIIIASNSFYQFKPFQEYEAKLKFIYYFFILIALVLAYVHSPNNYRIRSFLNSEQPVKLVISLTFVTIFSICNAFIFKDQPVLIGLMTSLQTLSVYFLFFAIIGLGLNIREFENLIMLFGVTYMIILLLGYITLPDPIFGSFGIEEGRGGIRFRIPGYFWTVALYFYSIQQFRDKGEKKFLILIILCLFASVFTFARQYILYSLLLGFIFYLSGIPLRKKLIIIILGLFLALFVIPNTQLYKNYSTLTQEQLEKNKNEEEDVRVKDYRVFLYDYPRSTLQYLFGCGQGSYGNSAYGDELEMMARIEWLIHADAGWAGFVFYYGYMGVALLLLIILKNLFRRCSSRYCYLKYIIIYMSLCSLLGGTILYYNEYLLIFLSIYILCRVSATNRISYLMTYVIIRNFCMSLYRKKLIEAK